MFAIQSRFSAHSLPAGTVSLSLRQQLHSSCTDECGQVHGINSSTACPASTVVDKYNAICISHPHKMTLFHLPERLLGIFTDVSDVHQPPEWQYAVGQEGKLRFCQRLEKPL